MLICLESNVGIAYVRTDIITTRTMALYMLYKVAERKCWSIARSPELLDAIVSAHNYESIALL